MIQQGTRSLYVYLPRDNPQMIALAGQYNGVYDEPTSRWRFPNLHKVTILSQVAIPPDSGSDDDEDDNEEDDHPDKSPVRLDRRLHRAQSFSTYDSNSESDDCDNQDFRLNSNHKVRKQLSPAQYRYRRDKIHQSIQNCKHESATKRIYDNQVASYDKVPISSPGVSRAARGGL